jgi:hypothetical protein
MLKSYASGCTALTGVEAVSDGVGAFREDRVKNARRTPSLMIVAMGIMLAGIAYLVSVLPIRITISIRAFFPCCSARSWVAAGFIT